MAHRRRLQRIFLPGFFAVVLAAASGAVTSTAHASSNSANASLPPYIHSVPFPSWWNGTCDSGRHSASRQVASWAGLIACAPAATGLNEIGPLAPNNEWQCVELAERWLYQEFGLPVILGDGWQIVQKYGASLAHHAGTPLSVASPGTGVPIGPGDVVSYGTSAPGHVAVVTSSTLDSKGNGTYTVIQENTAGTATLAVKGWKPAGEYSLHGPYMPVTGWLHIKPGPTTTISPATGYPVDPICHDNKIPQPSTILTVNGHYYRPSDQLAVHSAQVLLGTPVVGADGSWQLTFTVPSRPDNLHEPVTVTDASGTLFTGTFISGAYTCYLLSVSLGKMAWDAVGWDSYSPMSFWIDGRQMDAFDAYQDGSLPARSFSYHCLAGSQHTWTVYGGFGGGVGHAGGTFTCRFKGQSRPAG